LIEVLVAALVLGVGLLGLAALQIQGLRSNFSANLRSQGTLLAYDIADRMRVNLAGFEHGEYNNPTASDHGCVWKEGSTTANCTTQQMAAHDVWEWNGTVVRELPKGTGVVCLDSTPNDGGDTNGDGTVAASEYACDNTGSTYVVKLWWVDELGVDANSGSPASIIKGFVTEVRP